VSNSYRPKVVHVVVAGGISGVVRFLESLATRPELSGARHCVALFTTSNAIGDYFRASGMSVREHERISEDPLSYLWRSFGPSDVEWLCKVLSEEDASCVHAHTFGSFTLATRAGLRMQIPVVRTEHGIDYFSDPSCAIFRRWTLRHADRIVPVSEFSGRVVAAYDPCVEARIRVIPNGIELARYPAVDMPDAERFTFVIVARLFRIKQIHLAVEALSQLEGAFLNIVGDGPELGNLMSLVRSRGIEKRVAFHGFMEDPRSVIAASHAAINCSRSEGLSLSLIEAAAMQRPAVSFVVGGSSEIVRNDETGWLTKANTLGELVEAMRMAMSDRNRASRYGVNARKRVAEHFEVNEMCRAYAALYSEVTAKR
jgi:glycosyltransferase involved in cell wall biosynthesis